MLISTKGRYAARLMLDIAENEKGSPVSLKEVSTRQGISEKYLEQIISSLNKAGMVRSIRGAQGGYVLVKAPKDYTVRDILEATEGNLASVDCLKKGAVDCDKMSACSTVKVWKKIDDAINEVIDNISLQDMLLWDQEEV